MWAVELQRVHFAYTPEQPVLEDVTLRVGQQDFVAVLGPNGGGKSTLFRLILGLLAPKSGSIRVLNALPGQAAGRIGFVPQAHGGAQQFPIEVQEVVALGSAEARTWGWGFSRNTKRKAEEMLERVGVSELRRRRWAALSGGQRQRVLIARALMSDPAVLLLDEPTASLDVNAKEQLYALLGELNRDKTLLVITHDLSMVPHVAKSIATVNRKLHFHPRPEINEQVLHAMCSHELPQVCSAVPGHPAIADVA
jgi:zinc transport system ATP-binding protein